MKCASLVAAVILPAVAGHLPIAAAQTLAPLTRPFPADDWKEFRNIELWEYCIHLPLNGYIQNHKKSDVKAKHVFVHRSNKQREMTLWGMNRSDEGKRLGPEQYYKQYFAGAEEKGLVIEERKLDIAARRFYSWGYWSNSYYTTRFLEIVWLREDELVKLHITFPVADTPLWKTRLPELMQQTSVCKSG